MRRSVTIGGIVVTALLASSIAAAAAPARSEASLARPAGCTTPADPSAPPDLRALTSPTPGDPAPVNPAALDPVAPAPVAAGPAEQAASLAAQAKVLAGSAGGVAAWTSTIAKDGAALADAASALARDIGALTGHAPVSAAPLAAAAGLVPAAPAPQPAAACDPDEPTGYATSAAAKFGWGTPNRVEDFTGSLDKSWILYDGPGNDGKGRRTPDAVSINDGVMTITGDSKGDTDGMAWGKGQKYGRWEGRIKAPVGDRSYNALLLLWPDAENWPVGGEVDFMEMSDHARASTNLFLHYGKDDSQLEGSVKVDATQWHDWAVEWTSTHITAFLDGEQWWTTSNTHALPPGPMHLTIQLDWFPKGGSVSKTSEMDVDWVRQYPFPGNTDDRADPADPDTTDRADGPSKGGSERAADAASGPAVTSAVLPSAVPADTEPGLVPAAVASP